MKIAPPTHAQTIATVDDEFETGGFVSKILLALGEGALPVVVGRAEEVGSDSDSVLVGDEEEEGVGVEVSTVEAAEDPPVESEKMGGVEGMGTSISTSSSIV